MTKAIISGNAARVRPGQFPGICFQADGGEDTTTETKVETKQAEVKPDPAFEAMKLENTRLKKFETEAVKASKEAEKAKLDEVDRAKLEIKEAKAEAVAARKEASATKHNLPDAIAELLKGETREEIDAHAATLAALFPAKAKTPANTGTAADTKDPAASRTDAIAEAKAALDSAKEARDPLKVLRCLTKLAQLEAAGK